MSATAESNGEWERHLDKKSGKYYFHNKVTKKTVWKRPKDYVKRSKTRTSESISNTQTTGRKATRRWKTGLSASDFKGNNHMVQDGHMENMIKTDNPMNKQVEHNSDVDSVELTELTGQKPALAQIKHGLSSASTSARPEEVESESTVDKGALTSAWKRNGSDVAKKAKRAMRKLQMMQRLKKQKETVRENVLDTMDAISYTARNFRHRARDIVNITNLAFLVIALGLVISVSFSTGRKSIDSAMSYLGIREVDKSHQTKALQHNSSKNHITNV